MQTIFSSQKVNNEIELCEVESLECKTIIERELLNNHISFFVRWPKTSFFSRRKNICIICVNENAVDTAEAVISQVANDYGFDVRFIFRRSQLNFL